MSLIECSECKGIVSKRGKTCPHCGNPDLGLRVREKPKTDNFKINEQDYSSKVEDLVNRAPILAAQFSGYLSKYKMQITALLMLAIVGVILLSDSNSINASTSSQPNKSPSKTCKHYLKQLNANQAKFKKFINESPSITVSGRITDIEEAGSLLYSARGKITLDYSCHVSVGFKNGFDEERLYKLSKGKKFSAKCSYATLAWLGDGIIFTGCEA